MLQCRTSQFQTLSLNLQPPSKLVPPLGSLVLNMCLECLISLCLWLSRVCVFFSPSDSTLNIPPGTIQNAENSATILFVYFTFSTLETVPNVQEKKTMISLFCIPFCLLQKSKKLSSHAFQCRCLITEACACRLC